MPELEELPEVAANVRSVFESFDKDKSGTLDVRELRKALEALGLKTDAQQATAVMAKYDGSADMKLDIHEFAKAHDEVKLFVDSTKAAAETAVDAKVRGVFEQVDRDKSGTLDPKELKRALEMLGLKTNVKEAATLLRKYDDSGDQRIDLVEFARVHADVKAYVDAAQAEELKHVDAKVRAVFERFDRDKSGTLDAKELRSALEDLGLQTSHTEAKTMLATYDSSADARLDLLEFSKVATAVRAFVDKQKADALAAVDARVRAVFERFDRDKSGTIDAKELRRGLEELGLQTSDGEAAKVLSRYDGSADGSTDKRLDLVEFSGLAADLKAFMEKQAAAEGPKIPAATVINTPKPLHGANMSELVAAAMVQFDTNGDGFISAKELRSALSAIGIPIETEQAARVLSVHDLNMDGKLSRKEFERLIGQLISSPGGAGLEVREALAKAVVPGMAALRWERFSGPMDLSDTATVVTRTRADCWDHALGSHIYSSGEHRFVLTVLGSEANSGACMLLGVADATRPPFEGSSVGFSPYFGALFTDADAYSGSAWGRRLVEANLRGCARGAKVEMLVDMDQRRLSVSVSYTDKAGQLKTSPMSDAGVELPAAVRPWVRLGHRGDSVSLKPA